MLLSIAIIAIAVIALYRILKDIELEELLDALRASDPRDIALAALLCIPHRHVEALSPYSFRRPNRRVSRATSVH